MHAPLIVSITSMPSRIGLIRPTLESLLAGDTRPDSIRLILPEKPMRGTATFEVPAFLTDPQFCGGVVEIVRVERDWGPGTKLLGAIRTITDPAILVVADDDNLYRRDFLTGLIEAQRREHGASFSYYTAPVGGIDKGQGADGFSFWTPNLDGLEAFFDAYVDGTDLMFHDDLWISFFLASRGVRVESLHHLLGGSLIYEPVHQVEALVNLDGNLGRERIEQRGIRSLMERVTMPAGRRRAIHMRALSRSAIDVARRTRRRLDRLFGRG